MDLKKFLEERRNWIEGEDEILSAFRAHLTDARDYRYSELESAMVSLLNHPGWKMLEDFVNHYIQRDALILAKQDTDPAIASAGMDKLDGQLWAARTARRGGKIEGLAFVVNLPTSLLGQVHDARIQSKQEPEPAAGGADSADVE